MAVQKWLLRLKWIVSALTPSPPKSKYIMCVPLAAHLSVCLRFLCSNACAASVPLVTAWACLHEQPRAH